MRKNYTHEVNTVITRNDFIEAVENKKAVILVENSLLQEIKPDITSELNTEKDTRKTKKNFKRLGIGGGILGFILSTHPIGWLVAGGATYVIGKLIGSDTLFKDYRVYLGMDCDGKEILVLHLKNNVDPCYDTIQYPPTVREARIAQITKKGKIVKI